MELASVCFIPLLKQVLFCSKTLGRSKNKMYCVRAFYNN